MIVRIAPEIDVRVARRAIAGVVAPEPEELEAPEEPEPTGPTPGT